ncbi:MAG: helix-turn-helix transcriptional regulator [Bacteroidia bacterium]|jgi:putative transcriptional regulator|nr:helix-turn-helix transcriptional regulator [Bacteroidia bacterium]MCF8426448.1 helix-turn-helix transcriptional regulator [Bacteroidia bacterium]MCF8447630.1 helix-turn-helix transcriptional regulator [Bacteroidia bacterium]
MKNRIRQERAEHQLSQQELAEKIGVSRQTIISIETGKYTPSTELALKLSLVFDKSVNELFSLD